MAASTTMIAMGASAAIVGGLVVGLGVLNFVVGAIETLFGQPTLVFLKPSKPGAFAFAFKWDSSKEPAKMHRFKIRLYNPFGKPTQLEFSKDFEPIDQSFAMEIDFGESFKKFTNLEGFNKALIEIEISSFKDGLNFQFDFKGPQYKDKFLKATKTVSEYLEETHLDEASTSKPPVEIPERSFIAETVPGKGAQIAIPTNPLFAAYFQGTGGGANAGGAPAAAAENFKISKVWIVPGFIVCNSCEDIYPEVFDVQADTCLIRPNPPLDDGLKIQEAAEACPVEVIKFTKAS